MSTFEESEFTASSTIDGERSNAEEIAISKDNGNSQEHIVQNEPIDAANKSTSTSTHKLKNSSKPLNSSQMSKTFGSTGSVMGSRRSSSVPPGSRGRPSKFSAISIRASDANSIVDLYEKSRISLGSNGLEYSKRSSEGRISVGSGFSTDQLGESDIGRSIDARRARKIAHEQAVLLENRVSRLQRLEELYKKRIEQTVKQTELIKENKERHQKDLVEKYKQKLQKVESVKKLAKQNGKKAETLKRSVKESRMKCLMEKRKRAEEEKKEKERRKQQMREVELNLVRQKREKINNMTAERQNLRFKRKQSFSHQIQKKYLENSEHIAFEAQLRQKLNERSDIMCDKELEAIERLKRLETEQQKAVKALRNVLS